MNVPPLVAADSITSGGLRMTTLRVIVQSADFAEIAVQPDLIVSIPRYIRRAGPIGTFETIPLILTSGCWITVTDYLASHSAGSISLLGWEIRRALRDSIPNKIGDGDWHLPFVGEDDQYLAIRRALRDARTLGITIEQVWDAAMQLAARVSAVRCSRGGIGVRGGIGSTIPADFNHDLDLFSSEVENDVSGLFYTQHPSTPDCIDSENRWTNGALHGRAAGWIPALRFIQFDRWKHRTEQGAETKNERVIQFAGHREKRAGRGSPDGRACGHDGMPGERQSPNDGADLRNVHQAHVGERRNPDACEGRLP